LSKIALFEFSIPNGIIPDGDTIIEVYGTRSTDSNDTVRIIVRTDNDLYGISRSRTNNEYQYSAFDGTEEYKISSLFNLSDDETVNHILVVRDSTVSYGEYVTIVTTSENRVMMFGSTFRSENFYLPTNSDTEIIDYTDLLDISMDTEILELDYYSGAVSIYINDGSFYRINLKGEPYGFNYKTYMDAIKYIEPSMVTFKQATFTVEDNLLEIAALTLAYDNATKLYIDSLYTDEMITINPFEGRHHYFFVYPE